MTGEQKSFREKLGAVFFAFIMVTSVVAIGSAAFAGTAAAAVNDGDTNNVNIIDAQPVQPDATDVTVEFDVTGSAQDVVIGIDADTDGAIQSDEVLTTQQNVGIGDDNQVDVTPTDAAELSATTDTNGLDVVAVGDGDTDGFDDATPITVSSVDGNSKTTLDVDGVAPTLQSAVKTGPVTYTLTFSEPVGANGAAGGTFSNTEGDDFDYFNVNSADANENFNSVSGAGSSTVSVDMTNTISNNDLGVDQIAAVSAEVTDAAGNQAPGTAVTVQSSSLAGGGDGTVSYEISGGDAGSVVTGSADNELGGISIRDQASGEFRGTVSLSFGPAVTINNSSSELTTNTVVSSTRDLNINAVNVVNNSHTLEIDVSGNSNTGEQIDIASGALHVAVNGSEVDTTTNPKELPATIETFGNTLNIRASGGETGNEGFLDAEVVATTFPGQATPSADSTGQNLGDEVKLNDVDANEIGDGTAITLSVESGTGVTFDQSVDPTDASSLVVSDAESPGDLNIDDANSDKELDIANATLTATTLTIPVNSSISGSGHDIFFDTDSNLAFNVSGDASNADLNASIAAASPNTGSYQLGAISSGAKQSTNANQIAPSKPVMDFNDGNDDNADAVIGLDEQSPIPVSGNAEISIDTSSATLAGGKFLNITTNNSAVTFDQSVTNDETVDATDLSGSDVPANINNVTVTKNEIAIGIASGGTGNNADSITIDLADDTFDLNVSNSPADDTKVQFNATIGPVVISDSSNVLQLERPDVTFNKDQGSNATVDVDTDGRNAVEIGDNSDTDDALLITADDIPGHIQQSTFLNVTLESNTGVTFDTRFDGNATADNTQGDDDKIEVTKSGSVTLNNVTVKQNTLAIGISGTGSSAADTIEIDELFVNATGSASNTTLSVTTNTGSQKVTTDFNNIIATNAVNPNDAFVDADVTDGDTDGGEGPSGGNNHGVEGDNSAAGSVVIGNSVNSSVFVKDGSFGFGDADVSLELISQPDGSNFTTDDVLNRTSTTTASDGTAGYQFSAPSDAVTGDYIINASTSDGSVNATYTITAGNAASVNVTAVKDARTSSGGAVDDTEEAIFRVRVEDSAGNLVSDANINFATIIGGNADRSSEGTTAFYDNYTVTDGTDDGANAFSTGTKVNYDATSESNDAEVRGEFFVALEDSTAESVSLEIRPDSNNINSDSATAQFFGGANSVSVELNRSSATTNDSKVAALVSPVDSNGDTITVPRVEIDDVSSGNTTVATVDDTTPETNNSGIAESLINIEGTTGTASIDVLENNKGASTTLNITVEEAQAQEPSVSVNFTDQTVPNGTEEVTVDSANFTRADGSAGDYVVVVHTIDEFGAPVGNVSAPIGASGDLTGAEENITVDLTAADGPIDSITENVTLRAMLHTTDNNSAFGTRLGNAIDGIEPGDETDDANITVSEDIFAEPVPGTGADSPPQDPNGDGTFEDVNGDDQVNFDDVIDLAFALPEADNLTDQQRNALDIDGDDDVDFDDVIDLAFQV